MFKRIEDNKIKHIEKSYNNLRKERIENMKRRLKMEELKEKEEKIKLFQKKKDILKQIQWVDMICILLRNTHAGDQSHRKKAEFDHREISPAAVLRILITNSQ